ncbi:MAG TPA: glycosyltransferase family 2 protein [Ktedonobacterales bacterium]|nr:glycosyltransferase family 2 protein [Ktedonobacterales bacterium]
MIVTALWPGLMWLAGLHWLVLAAELWLALPLAYLGLLAVSAAIEGRRRARAPLPPAPGERAPRLAVLIPAHDEEELLPALLASLKRQTYPRERFEVCVVADNCTDRTAEIARAAGVQAFERHDTVRRGKGYALNWVLAELETREQRYDGYLVFDADSVVEPGFLAAMAAELARGARACQGSNTVLNTTESPSTVLRWLALTLMNHVRPLGRNSLGGSSALTGNGMCLSRSLLERFPWEAFGVAEDYQYYLQIVTAGERVRYVPAAVVRSHMPTSFDQMRSQDVRWESSAPETPRWQVALALLRAGLRERDRVRLDALAELLAPTLSRLAGGVALVVVLAALVGTPLEWALAGALLALLLLYAGSALYTLRPGAAVYRALLYAPGYMAWKLWVQIVLRRSKRHAGTWVRTRRPAEAQ